MSALLPLLITGLRCDILYSGSLCRQCCEKSEMAATAMGARRVIAALWPLPPWIRNQGATSLLPLSIEDAEEDRVRIGGGDWTDPTTE